MKTVKQRESKKILVHTSDGSVWSAFIGPGGHLYYGSKMLGEMEEPGPLPKLKREGDSLKPTNPDDGNPGKPTPPKPTDRNFRERLKSVLKDNNTLRTSRHRLRGALDLRALTRVQVDRQDVFKQKGTQGLKYSILVLVDESGSMAQENKNTVAAEAVRFLGEHLSKAEGIRLAITGFNHTIKPYKSFEQTYDYALLEQQIIARVASNNAQCNHDQLAVRAAIADLRKEKEKTKKILLYLSDGEPGGCEGSNEPTVIANEIRAATDITTIGIGILYQPMQIPNHIVVNNLNELKPRLLNALKAQIKRGEL